MHSSRANLRRFLVSSPVWTTRSYRSRWMLKPIYSQAHSAKKKLRILWGHDTGAWYILLQTKHLSNKNKLWRKNMDVFGGVNLRGRFVWPRGKNRDGPTSRWFWAEINQRIATPHIIAGIWNTTNHPLTRKTPNIADQKVLRLLDSCCLLRPQTAIGRGTKGPAALREQLFFSTKTWQRKGMSTAYRTGTCVMQYCHEKV